MPDETLTGESDRPTVPAPPSNEYVCMVLLVDDQAIVGETVRRMLADPSRQPVRRRARSISGITRGGHSGTSI